MKLKVSFFKLEHKKWGNSNRKYKIIGYDRHLPYAIDVDVSFCYIFCAVAELIV